MCQRIREWIQLNEAEIQHREEDRRTGGRTEGQEEGGQEGGQERSPGLIKAHEILIHDSDPGGTISASGFDPLSC